jgi:hypothetical protein
MSGEPPFNYVPVMSDHYLTYAYGYASILMPLGEAWLVRPLLDWLTGAEAELERRGLLKDAKRTKKLLLKEFHAHVTPPNASARPRLVGPPP